jgi:hypothetical protein
MAQCPPCASCPPPCCSPPRCPRPCPPAPTICPPASRACGPRPGPSASTAPFTTSTRADSPTIRTCWHHWTTSPSSARRSGTTWPAWWTRNVSRTARRGWSNMPTCSPGSSRPTAWTPRPWSPSGAWRATTAAPSARSRCWDRWRLCPAPAGARPSSAANCSPPSSCCSPATCGPRAWWAPGPVRSATPSSCPRPMPASRWTATATVVATWSAASPTRWPRPPTTSSAAAGRAADPGVTRSSCRRVSTRR